MRGGRVAVGLVDVTYYLSQWLAKQGVRPKGDVIGAGVVVVIDFATAAHAVLGWVLLAWVVFHILFG